MCGRHTHVHVCIITCYLARYLHCNDVSHHVSECVKLQVVDPSLSYSTYVVYVDMIPVTDKNTYGDEPVVATPAGVSCLVYTGLK